MSFQRRYHCPWWLSLGQLWVHLGSSYAVTKVIIYKDALQTVWSYTMRKSWNIFIWNRTRCFMNTMVCFAYFSDWLKSVKTFEPLCAELSLPWEPSVGNETCKEALWIWCITPVVWLTSAEAFSWKVFAYHEVEKAKNFSFKCFYTIEVDSSVDLNHWKHSGELKKLLITYFLKDG